MKISRMGVSNLPATSNEKAEIIPALESQFSPKHKNHWTRLSKSRTRLGGPGCIQRLTCKWDGRLELSIRNDKNR